MSAPQQQLTPVSYKHVRFGDGFWAPRIATNRTVTIPHIYRKLEETGRISAFDLNFERPVPSPIVLIFGDSDPAKWVEAASYSLAVHPDPALAGIVDAVVDKVVAAQQPDGYLNTHFIRTQPDMRWKNLRDWHELYCAGHWMEAAVAHVEATGDRKLLDALCRYANHIDATFGREPGKLAGYPGHPEIELALVRLYRATGNDRYLRLATYFVDERGAQPHYYDIEARARGEDPAAFWAKTYEYCQAHLPLHEQEKVVGHAVRAVYLLSAATDLSHENGDATLLATAGRLWDNLIGRRMYLTGGIGPSRHNEGFTLDYDLPDETAYAETCATIGLMLWAHRLAQFEGDCRYTDVLERGLYNGFLSGVSLAGDTFFYENPLASAGDRRREPWFTCPCCPPNIARVLASLGGYFYSTYPDSAWIHLYGSSTATLDVAGRPVTLRQVTRYPWDGAVRITLDPAAAQRFTLHLRVPGWCTDWQVRINGEPLADAAPEANGYLALTCEWQPGDVVDFDMAMPIRTIHPHPAIRQLQGRVALQRGPLVYCLEAADHGPADGELDRIAVDPAAVTGGKFTDEYRPDLLGGVVVLRGQARVIDASDWAEGELYRTEPPTTRDIELLAIPYYAWANRTPGEMRVWLRAAAL
jgi:uncharacterized protein